MTAYDSDVEDFYTISKNVSNQVGDVGPGSSNTSALLSQLEQLSVREALDLSSTKEAARSIEPPLGFFDLSTEIRFMIYKHALVLPSQVCTFPQLQLYLHGDLFPRKSAVHTATGPCSSRTWRSARHLQRKQLQSCSEVIPPPSTTFPT